MMITMCAFKGRIFGHGIIVFVARVRKRVWGRRGRSTRSGSVYMRVYCTVFEMFFFLFLLAFFFMAMFFSSPSFVKVGETSDGLGERAPLHVEALSSFGEAWEAGNFL